MNDGISQSHHLFDREGSIDFAANLTSNESTFWLRRGRGEIPEPAGDLNFNLFFLTEYFANIGANAHEPF